MPAVAAVKPIDIGTGLVNYSAGKCSVSTVTRTDSLGIWSICDHCDLQKMYSWKYAKKHVLKLVVDS